MRCSSRALLRVLSPLVLCALALPLALGGCSNPLYAPCQSQADCVADLRCVNLGGDLGSMCTRACTITKARAGHPDVLDDDVLYQDGTTQLDTVADGQCSEGEVEVGSQDADGPQDLSVQGQVVGVCRVSAEQLANPQISNDSVLSGWCSPL